jgi:hypothetical protein
LSVLPPKPFQTDRATGSGAGFGAGFFSFFAPANPSQTDGLTKAGVGFGAGFFFRVVFFILFFVRAEALRFAFLDFFAMFNTTHCYSSYFIMSGSPQSSLKNCSPCTFKIGIGSSRTSPKANNVPGLLSPTTPVAALLLFNPPRYIRCMLWRNSRSRPLNAPAAFIYPCQPIVAKQPPTGPGWEVKNPKAPAATRALDGTF